MEHSNKEGNYVGVVHSLLSETEMDEIKNKTKGQMKATPYNIANTQLLFSYKRTCKVKYIRYYHLKLQTMKMKIIYLAKDQMNWQRK